MAQDKANVPAYASAAVGKHCVTTTPHLLGCHLLELAFARARRHQQQLHLLRSGDAAYLDQLEAAGLSNVFSFQLPGHLVLAAPEHVHFMLANIMTCFNEMKLPDSERAGPRVLDDTPPRQPRRTAAERPSSNPAPSPLTKEEEVVAFLVQRLGHKETVSMTDVNQTLPRRLGYRSNQPAVCKLFDFAQRLNVGVREGEPSTQGRPLCLQLSVSSISPQVRQRLGLGADDPEVADRGARETTYCT